MDMMRLARGTNVGTPGSRFSGLASLRSPLCESGHWAPDAQSCHWTNIAVTGRTTMSLADRRSQCTNRTSQVQKVPRG